jgi:ribokinase
VRVAVVGHVEHAQLAWVNHAARPGELVPATEWREEPAGGAAIAAVTALELGGEVELFAAVGDDPLGAAAVERFRGFGLRVHAVARGAQRRAFIQLDADGERTIITMGERTVPSGADPLPWERLGACDGVYFTGGDAEALRAARAARVVVATPRAGAALGEAGVALDVLVRSANDPGERAAEEGLDPPPRYVVSTSGAEGGQWIGADHTTGTWRAATLPSPRGDAYGAGDAFAGGLTWALAAGRDIDAALQVAADSGARQLARRGPFGD